MSTHITPRFPLLFSYSPLPLFNNSLFVANPKLKGEAGVFRRLFLAKILLKSCFMSAYSPTRFFNAFPIFTIYAA